MDVHFHHIEQLVEEFKPKRVVIDSLSTYGSNLGTQGRIFRDFFHALVALMKEHQIAAVYNHENPEMLGMASMMGDFAMSSLVDNIILMNWVELGDTFRLGLTDRQDARPIRLTGSRTKLKFLTVKACACCRESCACPADQHPFSSYAGLVSRAPERRHVYRQRRDRGRGQ